MKNKIARAKLFIQENRTLLAFDAGVLVGVTCMIVAVKTKTADDLWLSAPDEAIQKLIDEPDGALSWLDNGRRIFLANEVAFQQ